MIPHFRDSLARPLQRIRIPTRSVGYIRHVDPIWGDEHSRLDGYVDGIEAARQALWHILHTERGWYPAIHRNNWGIQLVDLIGRSFGYVRAVLPRRIKDGVLQSDLFRDIRVVSITRPMPTEIHVECIAESVYGDFETGFSINLTESRP